MSSSEARSNGLLSSALDVVRSLAQVDSCAVSDAMDLLGLTGQRQGGAISGLRPVWEGARTLGRAVTMALADGPAPAGPPAVHLGARAIELCQPGDVIVVDNGGRSEMGAWGGLLSSAAQSRGVAGVVVDGACRDVDEARALKFPVFARAPVSRTARGRVHEVSVGQPVSLGGVTVRTGDVVLADGSGVVVISMDTATELIGAVERIVGQERAMLDRLRSGQSPTQVLDSSYEDMLGGR